MPKLSYTVKSVFSRNTGPVVYPRKPPARKQPDSHSRFDQNAEMANVDKAVNKSVKGADWIDDDEYNKHKLLVGLGSVLVGLGATLLGFSGKQVDKARKQRK